MNQRDRKKRVYVIAATELEVVTPEWCYLDENREPLSKKEERLRIQEWERLIERLYERGEK